MKDFIQIDLDHGEPVVAYPPRNASRHQQLQHLKKRAAQALAPFVGTRQNEMLLHSIQAALRQLLTDMVWAGFEAFSHLSWQVHFDRHDLVVQIVPLDQAGREFLTPDSDQYLDEMRLP